MGLILKLLGNKWAIGGVITLVGSLLAGTSIWVNAKQSGFEKGYTQAEDAYISTVQDTVDGVLNNRDEEWSSKLEEIRNEINSIVQQNERTEQQERLLRERLAEIQSGLATVNERIRTSDLGSCNLTPEFDSLFDEAAEGDRDTG